MRSAGSLIIALTTLASCTTVPRAQPGPVFEYRTYEGRVAQFDVSSLTLTTQDRSYQFVRCQLPGFVCLEAPSARIEIPLDCRGEEGTSALISRKGVTNFFSLDALTGNIFRYDTRGAQLAYAVHPQNGLTAFIVLSTSDTSKMEPADPDGRSTYRVVGLKGPFACAPAS